MAKVIFGNHSSVIVPRQDRNNIRKFYCDVLGGKITKEESDRDFLRLGENFYIGFLYGDVPDVSMLIGSASRVSQEVEKLVEPNVETNPERFLLIYINSLPTIARWPAAVAAESLLDGDLISFSRWLFMLTMVQCVLGAGCATLLLRAAYLVMTGASTATP